MRCFELFSANDFLNGIVIPPINADVVAKKDLRFIIHHNLSFVGAIENGLKELVSAIENSSLFLDVLFAVFLIFIDESFGTADHCHFSVIGREHGQVFICMEALVGCQRLFFAKRTYRLRLHLFYREGSSPDLLL